MTHLSFPLDTMDYLGLHTGVLAATVMIMRAEVLKQVIDDERQAAHYGFGTAA